MDQAVHRVVNLVPDHRQQILSPSLEEARALLLSERPEDVLSIQGSFSLVVRQGEHVCLARSLDRPLRYFLAKEKSGPLLVVAERIDEIREFLRQEGYGDQFPPTYTRMVPAHHVTRLRLIGCPDPNPEYLRFFDPPRATATEDLDALGDVYVGALCQELRAWLLAVPEKEPLGMLFSGGLDSGAVLLCLVRTMLDLGQSPARLKAFTLAVDSGGEGGLPQDLLPQDLLQARDFLRQVELEMLGEEIHGSSKDLDPLEAVRVIEDYKPLDVECATMVLALTRGIRQRYPDWRYLVDGDGGDENLKDYPIEENPELTIRSVVNNSMLYQEGWGVGAIKHSLSHSGGLSRGCVRGFAPLATCGFLGFSPFTRPSVVAAAEAIPFAQLTEGSHEKLYALKGEILRRGVQHHTGFDLPSFPKRRFQHGAASKEAFERLFSKEADVYRQHFLSVFTS